MKGRVRLASQSDLPRLAQMEMKTNQFNTMTPRYSSEQLEAFMNSPNNEIFVVELTDRLANHGLVSSVVVRRDGDTLDVMNWLMSCRVFGRTLEEFVVRGLMEYAAAHKIRHIKGYFESTERNAVASQIFPRLGFSDGGDGTWLSNAEPDNTPQTFVSKID